jgi:dTDP-glucose pyrophosphorylase
MQKVKQQDGGSSNLAFGLTAITNYVLNNDDAVSNMIMATKWNFDVGTYRKFKTVEIFTREKNYIEVDHCVI